jgi:hypothetical protein
LPTRLNGGGGDDYLGGAGGDDVFRSSTGDDTFAGGAGHDSLSYSGNRAEYDLRTYLNSEQRLVTSIANVGLNPLNGSSRDDGTDALFDIEELGFGLFSGGLPGYQEGEVKQYSTPVLAGAQLNKFANVAGSRFDDVLFQNATTGQVLFARMADGAMQDWGVGTAALGGGWEAIASGDVNPGLAGGAEIFVQQQSTGTILYASLDGGATAWGVVTAGLTADWKLRAVADVNGDASVDAIVQNQTTVASSAAGAS